MTGWRIGFAVGNREVVQNLGKLKTNIDSGAFDAVQWAAIEALTSNQESVVAMRTVFQKRRDIVVAGLASIGIQVPKPLATFYIWAHVPKDYTSADFAEKLIEEKGIVVTPGSGFGDEGEGYFILSITTGEDRIREAVERMRTLKL
jgi:LL-diaminopimelate aminotransferase